MRRLSTLLVVFVLFAVTTTSAGCGLYNSETSDTKESSPTVAESTQPPTSATSPPTRPFRPPPSPTVPDKEPAKRLACGTWKVVTSDSGLDWQFADGNIYSPHDSDRLYRAGAYEVVDDTHVRTVMFMDFDFDDSNPATYPWKTSEVFYLGSNRVWVVKPFQIMSHDYAIELVKISD